MKILDVLNGIRLNIYRRVEITWNIFILFIIENVLKSIFSIRARGRNHSGRKKLKVLQRWLASY
jgi:hypothetical protein